jgi:CBS domain-containing protein
MVSEGDLLHRSETATERHRSRWLEMLSPNASLAAEYVKSHGRKARDVMSEGVVTVDVDTPVAEIADLLERRRIKRVPVLRQKRLVGIVSRSNLLQAMASIARPASAAAVSDQRIREALFAELAQRKWAAPPSDANIIVEGGVVHLWGAVQSEDERKAMVVAAENITGVRRVEDHMSLAVPPLL